MKPVIVYCYDAYCGWCYGFSHVIKEIGETFRHRADQEVLSGGMILPEKPVHISAMAGYIQGAYKTVEERSGVTFGPDYLWHIFNDQDTDWFPNSEKPAIALCIFREYFPDKVFEFAADLQYALHFEGRDLTDNEAYRHLLLRYGINADDFYNKLKSPEYREKAYYDFALVKQLKVTGYPTVLVQTSDLTFEMVARGYTDYPVIKQRIEAVLDNHSGTENEQH